MAQLTELGVMRGIELRAVVEDAEQYTLVLTLEAGNRVGIPASREALRSLWSHLTQILYPRAADQLTKRMETVVRRKDGVPPGLTYMLTAYPKTNNPETIVVGGCTPEIFWTTKLTWLTTEDLWMVLEDKLNQV